MAYVHGCISIIVKSKFRMTDKEQYLGGKCSNMQLVLIKTLIPWTDFKSKQYKKKKEENMYRYVDLLFQGFAICTI